MKGVGEKVFTAQRSWVVSPARLYHSVWLSCRTVLHIVGDAVQWRVLGAGWVLCCVG
jgi:hypothetical protein